MGPLVAVGIAVGFSIIVVIVVGIGVLSREWDDLDPDWDDEDL